MSSWSREAEAAVLGAVMLDDSSFHEVAGLLKPESFYLEAHRKVWRACCRLVADGSPIDCVTVCNELSRVNELDKVGGMHFVAKLSSSVPTVANIEGYANILVEQASCRAAEVVAADVLESIHRGESADKVWEKFEGGLSAVSAQAQCAGAISQATVVVEAMEQLKNAKMNSGISGLTTGLSHLDEISGGLQESQLVIIAARPSMGKSALGLQISMEAARNLSQENKQVLVASLEMGRVELMLRQLSSVSGVTSSNIKRLDLSELEVQNIEEAAKLIAKLPISYLDEGVFTPGTLLSRVRREMNKRPIGLVVVDYLQLMESPRAESRESAVSACSRSLKAMARTLKCPVVALAQLNRQCENRVDKRPVLSDLRDSGAIEQDADQVWFLFRNGYYTKDDKDKTAEIRIAKNRSGPVGTIHVSFDARTTSFREGFLP